MATFRVARASEYLAITGCGVDDVKLAKKAWVWLGLQRCKTLDVSPVTYQLTSESFPVFLTAALTVGPKIKNAASSPGENAKKPAADEEEDPLLLYAKLVAPSRGKNKGVCSRSHVKQLVQGVLDGHVAAVAAGMTAEQIHVKGSASFAKKVLDRVQADVAKFGIHVYHGNVKWFMIQVPASNYLADVRRKTAQLGAATVVKNQQDNKVADVTQEQEKVGFLVQARIGDSSREPANNKAAEQLSSRTTAVASNTQEAQEWNAVFQKVVTQELLKVAVEMFELDDGRFFEHETPKIIYRVLDKAHKAVVGLLGGEGKISATQQADLPLLEQEMNKIADDDEMTPTVQEQSTGAAAPAGNAN